MTASPPSLPSKFTMYNFKGDPVAYYLIDDESPPTPKPQPEVTEYVIVVDASGSMYGVIRDTRTMIEKVLTVQEYKNSGMRVSLISYSSRGDVIVHFERVTIEEIMKPGSRYVEDIRRIEARGLTCASQAFDIAIGIAAKAPGTVGIVLHTDGFFNDPSPAMEMRTFDALITKAAKVRNLFVNTIAYGYADYVVMSKIANSLSGKCLKAQTITQVYDALHDTQALLAGRLTPGFSSPIEGADYQVFTNTTQRKINGTTADLMIRGGGPDDAVAVYRYRKVTEAAFNKAKGQPAVHGMIYAFARAKLAEGRLNDAKYALSSTANRTLLTKHAKALTNAQLTAFALDLELAMFGNEHYDYAATPGLKSTTGPTLLSLFALLNEHTDAFTVDLERLRDGYKRQGMKKIAGLWSHENVASADEEAMKKALAESKFTPASLWLEPDDEPTMVATSGFSVNNAEATINLLVTRPAKLMKEGKIVRSVAGIPLKSLTMFNNYTIVGSGDVNVHALPIRVGRKGLWDQLVNLGAVSPQHDFLPGSLYFLPIADMPSVQFDAKFNEIPHDLLTKMAIRKSAISLCDAILKLRSANDTKSATVTAFTKEQEDALSDHHLTPALYFSPPMRNPYTSKATAIAHGLIDFRTRYKIEIGSTEFLSLSDVPSAGDFFKRRFQGVKAGEKKPVSIADLYADASDAGLDKIEEKPTGRMKLGWVDDKLFDLYAGFAGTAKTGDRWFVDMLGAIGIPKSASKAMLSRNLAVAQTGAKEVRALLAEDQERDYTSFVRPLAFYIGASGLIPDDWKDAEMLDSVALAARFPALKGSEKENYIVWGTTVITLSSEAVEVLTEAGMAEVKRLTGGDGADA